MFCDHCGAAISDTARFCPSCGAALGGGAPYAPPGGAQGRVARHARIAGICWLILSFFRLVPALVLMGISHVPRFIPGVPFFVHGILSGIGFLFMFFALLGLVAGWGLMQHEPWARMLAIVLAVVNLIEFPLGTALGIYTLWVLLPAESEREYRSLRGV